VRVIGLGVACWLLAAVSVEAATYYVRKDGSDSNTGLANTGAGAWLTIDKCANSLSPGDTCRVQAGAYTERVTPAVSGTLGNPITFVADGAVTFGCILDTDHDYLRWIGFTIDADTPAECVTQARVVYVTGTLVGWEFWNNTIRDGRIAGIAAANRTDQLNNWIIIGNTFGPFPGVGADAVSISLRGADIIVAYNSISGSDPDIFYPHNNDSYYLNNYIQMSITAGRHGDVYQAGSNLLGYSRNVFEANFHLGLGNSSDEHGILFQDLGEDACDDTDTCGPITDNVFRRNVWHNYSTNTFGPESSATVGILNTRIYHETFVDTERVAPGSPAYTATIRNINFATSGITNTGFFFNNIADDAWSPSVSTNITVFTISGSGAAWTAADYNLAYESGVTLTFAASWSAQTSEQSNVDPVFTNRAADNFTLQASSGAIGVAGPLTATSGAGTGTTFSVATGGGGFFRGPNTDIDQYDGALTEGDVITVGTDTVTVVSVSGDDITVTPSFTWADGESVYYGNDTTPDIGAFPYKAGGYTLSATYTGTNITPNDASLVRFVVCYDDSVPYQVDNSSPYACSSPTGTFSARVYPRYAGTTLWADATPSGAPARIRRRP
jgi:hypothetical protein